MTPVKRNKPVLILSNWQNKVTLGAAFTASAAKAVSAIFAAERCARGGSVNVCVMDDSRIRAVNRLYLGHNYATDVISFNLQGRKAGAMEAEIAVSAQTAARNASKYGNSTEKELLVYIIHGVLHAMGYDDRTETERALMQKKTDAVIDQLFPAKKKRKARE